MNNNYNNPWDNKSRNYDFWDNPTPKKQQNSNPFSSFTEDEYVDNKVIKQETYQTLVPEEITETRDLEEVNVDKTPIKLPSRLRCISAFKSNTYNWMLMWIAIGFSLITIISAITVAALAKQNLRPDDIGWGGLIPLIVIGGIWAILTIVGYSCDLRENLIFSIINYILTIATFTALVWWISYICFVPVRANILKPIDHLKLYSFIMMTGILSLLIWVFWAIVTFMPTSWEPGPWAMLGMGTGIIILPMLAVLVPLFIFHNDKFNIEFISFGGTLIGLFFLFMLIFFLVIFHEGECDEPELGLSWAAIFISSYLIAVVLVLIALVYLIKWIVQLIADR